MYKYDYTDMAGGALLMLTGGSVAATAIAYYPLGTLQRMGPGMFPAGLGALLVLFGSVLVLQAIGRPGVRPDIRVISPLFVLGGVAAFAATIVPFGLIPAILCVTIISSFANLKIDPISLALLCLALCLIAPFVFVFCLGLQIPLLRWPF